MPVVQQRSLHVLRPAVPAAVPALRDEVAEFAARALAAAEGRLEAIKLAVSEAVTNVVRHAYRGRAGDIELCARVDHGALSVVVSDTGCGQQAPSEDPGLGYGLAIIADACDELLVSQRPNGGTEVRMRFCGGEPR